MSAWAFGLTEPNGSVLRFFSNFGFSKITTDRFLKKLRIEMFWNRKFGSVRVCQESKLWRKNRHVRSSSSRRGNRHIDQDLWGGFSLWAIGLGLRSGKEGRTAFFFLGVNESGDGVEPSVWTSVLRCFSLNRPEWPNWLNKLQFFRFADWKFKRFFGFGLISFGSRLFGHRLRFLGFYAHPDTHASIDHAYRVSLYA